MGDVLPFKKPDLKQKAKGRTLCKSGFHQWQILNERRFDVKQGRLVTTEQCSRCGQTRTRAKD